MAEPSRGNPSGSRSQHSAPPGRSTSLPLMLGWMSPMFEDSWRSLDTLNSSPPRCSRTTWSVSSCLGHRLACTRSATLTLESTTYANSARQE
eukprot:2370863-Rhodomonas_salina.1